MQFPSLTVWLHLVDHKFQLLGDCFKLEITTDYDIYDLKEILEKQRPDIFSDYNIERHCLTVWKTEGDLALNRSTAKLQEEILEKVDINDRNTIRMLDDNVLVVELQLLDCQFLLLQLPDLSSDLNVWVLLVIVVNHKFRVIRQPFQVRTFFDDEIRNLKNKVKEKKQDVFFYYEAVDIYSSSLTVWKTDGKSLLNAPTTNHLEVILDKIDFNDKDTIQKLDEDVTMAELQSSLAHGQILLARFPDVKRKKRYSMVSLLLVDEKFRAVGNVFQVRITMDDYVSRLKEKACAKLEARMPQIYSFYDINPDSLTVWKMEGEFVINMSTTKRLEEVFKSISTDTLDEHVKVAPDLQLSDNRTLLLKFLKEVGISKPDRMEELGVPYSLSRCVLC